MVKGAELWSVFVTSYGYHLGPLSNLSEPQLPHLEKRDNKAGASAEGPPVAPPDVLSTFLHLFWALGR